MYSLHTATLMLLVTAVHPNIGHKLPDTAQPEVHGLSRSDADIMVVVEQLKSEMMDMKAHHYDMTQDMKKHYDGVILEIKNSHDADIIKLVERHDADIMNMKERYDGMIQGLTGKYDEIKVTQEKEITELKERYNDLKTHSEMQISAIVQRYDDENGNIAELKQSYNFMKSQYPVLFKHNAFGVRNKEHGNQDKDKDIDRIIPAVENDSEARETVDQTNQHDSEDQAKTAPDTYSKTEQIQQFLQVSGGTLLDICHESIKANEVHAQGFVAFQAYLSTELNGAVGDTVIFDDVRINIGGGYDTLNGHFTAPVAGLYVISRSHLAGNTCGTATACAELFINGVKLSNTCSESVSSTAKLELVQLAAGDNVWQQLFGSCTIWIGVNNYDSFSGYLLIETI